MVANLELKYGWPLLPAGSLREATRLAHAIAEVTNVPPSARQPYVGLSSFAHKAGLHASAIKVDPNLYQHIDPAGSSGQPYLSSRLATMESNSALPVRSP